MKKYFAILSFSLAIIAVLALNQPPQKDKKDNPGQGQKPAKSAQPGKQADKKDDKKENQQGNDRQPGNSGNNQGKDKDNKANQGNQDNRANDNRANDNRGNDMKSNNGKDDDLYSMKWNRENFQDRKKVKNQKKVSICHKFNNNNEPAVSINVSENAVKAHLGHGDVLGDCPEVKDSRFSNIFLRNRTNYYNTLENTQEKVTYSRSILRYALDRLAGSRSQLTQMQNNNVAAADIQRKQATVVELEQNVSVLETLLNVAGSLVASRLQQ